LRVLADGDQLGRGENVDGEVLHAPWIIAQDQWRREHAPE
jgi:hypothetical protein